jgi:TRAP-type C4-dicarboxylate transport system permease small subunit
MMFLTIADVFLRKVLSKSILGTVEITEFMMVILVFFGLAQAEVVNGNVRVDILTKRFSEKTQQIIEVISQFCCFILFVLLTWYAFDYAVGKIGSGEVSQDLWIPMYPFVFIVGLGFTVLTIVLFFKSMLALLKVINS